MVNISIPVILLFLLFQLRALGAGDIKLLSVAGGFLTVGQLMYLIAATFLTAAIIGAGKLVYRKGILRQRKGKTLIHFSLAILIGYFITIWGCVIAQN